MCVCVLLDMTESALPPAVLFARLQHRCAPLGLQSVIGTACDRFPLRTTSFVDVIVAVGTILLVEPPGADAETVHSAETVVCGARLCALAAVRVLCRVYVMAGRG